MPLPLIMGILSAISAVLTIFNQIPVNVVKAEKAFDGKPGSGKRKKKLVLDAVQKGLNSAGVPAPDSKALLTEASKAVDNIVAATRIVNKMKE